MEFKTYDYLETNTRVSIVSDSISVLTGIRATTMLWHVPRFILPQLNTHRVFSRNVASSRAKRFSTLLKDANYHPKLWLKNHKGMQAESLLPTWKTWFADALWSSAKWSAITHAFLLDKLGASKQYTNRLIEPFCYVNYLVTSTEWSNFFYQRDDNHAQFEIQVLARKAKAALQENSPQILKEGEWHLPFVTGEDLPLIDKVKSSVARCAKTSYATPGQVVSNLKNEATLYDKLVKSRPPHLSPTEHQLLCSEEKRSGNVEGFTQFRKLLEKNNFDDSFLVDLTDN